MESKRTATGWWVSQLAMLTLAMTAHAAFAQATQQPKGPLIFNAQSLKVPPASVPISAAPLTSRLGPAISPIAHAASATKAINDGAIAISQTDPRTAVRDRDTSPHQAPPMKLRINAA